LKKPSKQRVLRAGVRERRIVVKEARRKLRRRAKRLHRKIAQDSRRLFAVRNQVYFDTNLERAQIILPESFSFTTNYEKCVNVINAMRFFTMNERRAVMLHFTALRHIEPAAALVLVAEIFKIRNLRGRASVWGTYPTDRATYDLLCDLGFYSLLDIPELGDIPRAPPAEVKPVFLRFMSDNRVDAESVDRFVGVIEKHILKLNELARERLVAAIIEAMANTLDHAHPTSPGSDVMRNRWWLSSCLRIQEREVTIVLFDQGVGIPRTLDPTAYESIRAALTNISQLRLSTQPSDGEMILAATEYHRSGTGSQGRGRGFADMKRFVDICTDGELRVLSNRGRYHYMTGTEAYDNAATSIGGTLIEWRFRHEGLVEMSDG
jgi:hypothetical protein